MTRTHHLALVGTMVLLALAPVRADANVFVCAAGDVPCLIQAINDANTNGLQDTIRLAAGTYTLTDIDNQTDGANGLPSITSTLTIRVIGGGTATIDRASTAPNFRIIHVAATGNLILKGVTLSNGVASGPGNSGGGLFNNGGVVTIRNGVVADNRAASGAGLLNNGGVVTITKSTIAHNGNISSTDGGGLLNLGGSVIISESTFSQNSAFGPGGLDNRGGYMRLVGSHITGNFGDHGVGGLRVAGGLVVINETTFRANSGAEGSGGIDVTSGATVVVTNSSFVENRAGSGGSNFAAGAISNREGTVLVRNTTFAGNIRRAVFAGPIAIQNFDHLTLVNSTFAGNVADIECCFPVGVSSVLFSLQNATTILKNTIIVHDPAEPLIQDCQGTITSGGNNIIGDLTGCTVNFQPGDLTGDAGLDAFTDDGTPGNGHFPLLTDSQAVDAGNDAFCPKRDQIGQLRKGQCDIGAIEFQPKKHSHHGWNDDDDEREDSWSRDQLDEGFDQPIGNPQTPEP